MGITAGLLKISKEQLPKMQSDNSLVDTLVMDVIQETVDANNYLDLYKSWNAMHVLLDDGESGVAADSVMGGDPIGEDMGYGPARILDVDAVAQIAADLAKISQEDFGSRFDVEKMTDVYSFDPDAAEREWETLSSLFEEIKTFYQNATEHSCGMLLFMV